MIIGITGTFGSGCTFIAKKYLVRDGFEYISLSECLRELYREENGSEENPNRKALQDYGDGLRKKNGADILAKRAAEKMHSDRSYIIDSIRNPAEIRYIDNKYANFFLLGVNADMEVRWERVKEKYGGNQGEFTVDEQRDKEGTDEYGQQVEQCFERADYVIINDKEIHNGNNNDNLMNSQVDRFFKLTRHERLFPNDMETAMTIAQAASLRSSCEKRQVGAAIVDELCSVVATGYNEVPPKSESCVDMCGECYRGSLRKQFRASVSEILKDVEKTELVCKYYKGNVKLMDYCRALHAEENAILSLVRNGSVQAISRMCLYTTTFPCNLCANKIASIGIKSVVYCSPYPMKEAKETLQKNGVTMTAFSGITYRGYFKLEGRKT